MSTYNGFPNFNQWNINLWIANDPGYYQTAECCLELAEGSIDGAARIFIDYYASHGKHGTPDGIRWSLVGVRRAIRNLQD